MAHRWSSYPEANWKVYSSLLLAIGIAYIPQIKRIVSHRSTQGISPLFLLFGALCCNLQLANTLFSSAYGWPTVDTTKTVLGLIHSGRLRGFKAFGAVLGLIQVAL